MLRMGKTQGIRFSTTPPRTPNKMACSTPSAEVLGAVATAAAGRGGSGAVVFVKFSNAPSTSPTPLNTAAALSRRSAAPPADIAKRNVPPLRWKRCSPYRTKRLLATNRYGSATSVPAGTTTSTATPPSATAKRAGHSTAWGSLWRASAKSGAVAAFGAPSPTGSVKPSCASSGTHSSSSQTTQLALASRAWVPPATRPCGTCISASSRIGPLKP